MQLKSFVIILTFCQRYFGASNIVEILCVTVEWYNRRLNVKSLKQPRQNIKTKDGTS